MKLTRRSLGLSDGYRSDYEKRELVQKLGSIEHEARELAEDVCDGYCRFRNQKLTRELIEPHCVECPVMRLLELIE